jgi:hypothetical protein
MAQIKHKIVTGQIFVINEKEVLQYISEYEGLLDIVRSPNLTERLHTIYKAVESRIVVEDFHDCDLCDNTCDGYCIKSKDHSHHFCVSCRKKYGDMFTCDTFYGNSKRLKFEADLNIVKNDLLDIDDDAKALWFKQLVMQELKWMSSFLSDSFAPSNVVLYSPTFIEIN